MRRKSQEKENTFEENIQDNIKNIEYSPMITPSNVVKLS